MTRRPTLILHIGRHKSGTSSLQHFLGANRDWLDRQGVLYPRAGCSNRIAHHRLAGQCNPEASDGAELASILAAMKAEIAPHHDRILLSSEAFQNVRKVSRLRQFITALGVGEVRVICYVREHLDYAISGFRQMVQNQDRFQTFANRAAGLGDMTPFIARWSGIGDLSLRWYDRPLLKNGDIIADVCGQLGLEPGEVSLGDMNPSIGGNLLVYKLAVNRLNLPRPGYGALSELARQHAPFRSPFRVPDADAAALRATSRYNASLFARLGEIRLKSWDGYPELPVIDTLEADLDRILPAAPAGPRAPLARQMRQAGAWFRCKVPVG